MAVKISELPAAVAATLADIFPVVQGGDTKRMSLSNMLTPIPLTEAEFNAVVANVNAATFTPMRGARYRITDGKCAGALLEWNGEAFGGYHNQAVAQNYATGKTRTSVSAAGDTTVLTVETVPIFGLLMGPNSKLRITTDWAFSATATQKSLSLKFGGTDVAAPTINGATLQSAKILTEIINVNSFTAQAAYNSTSYGSVGNAIITPGINTQNAFNIDFNARWITATPSTETISLIGYSIELLP
jgi:hypothetical protein